MQIVKPPTRIDVGVLLLAAAKNAPDIEPELQKVIAQYVGYLQTPIRMVQPIKHDIKAPEL